MIIDTHCHLVSSKYGDMEELRSNSLALGVGHCISQGTGPHDWAGTLELASRWPDFVSPCLAVHPSDCTEASDDDFARMAEMCRQHPQAAIGETGLDYFWDPPEGWSVEAYYARQRHLLELHFALAEELGLNISLHTRDKANAGTACFDDAFAIARHFPKVRPVFHCFIGTQQQAEAIFSELDGLVSFTGLITFKKTEHVQAVAAWCPADRFMVETDAPFLSPEPFRGVVNIPGRTRYVVEKIAQLRGSTPEEIAACTTANAMRFFRLPALNRG
ncbi:MAG: TatD family hydrolase [Akkermansia sp.]|nr:TatD family hydrolase [Akkermansia sp.]